MVDLSEALYELLRPLGVVGLLATVFLIFYIDAVVFPTLPELVLLLIFLADPTAQGADPTASWALLLLALVLAGELLGVFSLYSLVRAARTPKWIGRRINQYRRLLFVSDERAILLNRIAPVIPFMGAFIAFADWNLQRSLLFVAVGGVAKYAVLLSLAGLAFGYLQSDLASLVSLLIIGAVVATSFALAILRRRRLDRRLLDRGTPQEPR